MFVVFILALSSACSLWSLFIFLSKTKNTDKSQKSKLKRPHSAKILKTLCVQKTLTNSPMILRSTTGGPIFASPDESRGDTTNVTYISTVTVWSTRRHGGS